MRAAPGPMPSKLPKVGDAAKAIQRMVDRPDIRLCDSSIGQLWELYGDGTPAWITGSNVWMPAVFGPSLAVPSDYDVIFSTSEACDRFVKAVLDELNHRIPKNVGRYTLGKSAFGSHRVMHPDGAGIIDAWSLGESESIGEALMTYPHDYQRAAYLLSRSPSTGCLHRIARCRVVGRMEISMGSSYPGSPPRDGALDRQQGRRPAVRPRTGLSGLLRG